MGFTAGISQFREQEGLCFCEHMGHLGLCLVLLALSSGYLLLCIFSSQWLVPGKNHTGFWGGMGTSLCLHCKIIELPSPSAQLLESSSVAAKKI